MKAEQIIIGVIGVVIFVMISGAFLFLMGGAMSGQEEFECQKWQSEAKQYSGYYITAWQDAQCRHYGVIIEAPVQK